MPEDKRTPSLKAADTITNHPQRLVFATWQCHSIAFASVSVVAVDVVQQRIHLADDHLLLCLLLLCRLRCGCLPAARLLAQRSPACTAGERPPCLCLLLQAEVILDPQVYHSAILVIDTVPMLAAQTASNLAFGDPPSSSFWGFSMHITTTSAHPIRGTKTWKHMLSLMRRWVSR